MLGIKGNAPPTVVPAPRPAAPPIATSTLPRATVAVADVDQLIKAQNLPPSDGKASLFSRWLSSGSVSHADRAQLLHAVSLLTDDTASGIALGAGSSDGVDKLTNAFDRIEQVLHLHDPAVLNQLAPDVRARLESTLFQPLQQLETQLTPLLKNVPPELATSETVALNTTAHGTSDTVAIRRAGNVESKGIETFETSTVRGAAFTHKGIGYASYDEDAFSLRMVPGDDGRLIAVVADQAGGEDKLAKNGAASEAAVAAWEDAVAEGKDPRDAMVAAKDAVNALNGAQNKSAMTTLSGLVLDAKGIHTSSAGDSQVLLYSKDGKLKQRTHTDNYGEELARKGRPNSGLGYASMLTNVLGEKDVTLHQAEWGKPEAGDWLVLVTDGVGDMNLEAQQKAYDGGQPWNEWHLAATEREIGQLLAASRSPEDAARNVLTQVFANVRSGDGKRDNTTAVVLQVK